MSYPGFDRRWKKGGRVLDIQVKGPHFVLKIANETIQTFYNPDHDAIGVNDWIALDEKNQIVRVVPSMRAPISPNAQKDILKKWSLFLKCVREFFEKRDFLELHTPSLVVCPGTEPALDVFSTDLKNGTGTRKLFFAPSPERHLKKSLDMGFFKIL